MIPEDLYELVLTGEIPCEVEEVVYAAEGLEVDDEEEAYDAGELELDFSESSSSEPPRE